MRLRWQEERLSVTSVRATKTGMSLICMPHDALGGSIKYQSLSLSDYHSPESGAKGFPPSELFGWLSRSH